VELLQRTQATASWCKAWLDDARSSTGPLVLYSEGVDDQPRFVQRRQKMEPDQSSVPVPGTLLLGLEKPRFRVTEL
jgi:hypothetical protein